MSNEGIRTKLTIATKNSCNKWKVLYNNKKEIYVMGKKDKLIKRLKSRPKDFTFDEAETLLKYFDFAYSNKGKTSGSRVIFESEIMDALCFINHIHKKSLRLIRSNS